jgi:hypothetical protein
LIKLTDGRTSGSNIFQFSSELLTIESQPCSARWQGCLWNPYSFGEATVDLRVVTDSGFKLSLYGTELVNTLSGTRYQRHTPQSRTVRVTLPQRKCSPITLDYIDLAGTASLSLQWSHVPYASGLSMPAFVAIPSVYLAANVDACAAPPLNGSGLCATYFPNRFFTNPALARTENRSLSFDWKKAGPLPGINSFYRCVSFIFCFPCTGHSRTYSLRPARVLKDVCGIRTAAAPSFVSASHQMTAIVCGSTTFY